MSSGGDTMGHGLGKYYYKTMTTGSGGSAIVDFQRTFSRVYVQLASPGAAVDVQASLNGTNYGPLAYPTGNAVSAVVSMLSSYSNQIREIPGGLQYYKFINTTATGAGEVIRMWGSDE